MIDCECGRNMQEDGLCYYCSVLPLEEKVKALTDERDKQNLQHLSDLGQWTERECELLDGLKHGALALGDMEQERDNAMSTLFTTARALGQMEARAEAAEKQARLLAARGEEG